MRLAGLPSVNLRRKKWPVPPRQKSEHEGESQEVGGAGGQQEDRGVSLNMAPHQTPYHFLSELMLPTTE